MAPKSRTASRPVGQQPEVARVRVAVDAPCAAGAGEQQPHQQQPRAVAVGLVAGLDHSGQGCAADPGADEHAVLDGEHLRNADVGVIAVRIGEGGLRVGLQDVVHLVREPRAQLREQLPGVEPGCGGAQERGEPFQQAEVGDQRSTGSRVLDLDGDGSAVLPDSAVDLPDARRGDRSGIELAEQPAPPGREGPFELGGDEGSGHRRGGLLQRDQGLAVRARELLGQGGLHGRQRLTDLHRAALELAERGEQLLGRARLHLRGDRLTRSTTETPAESECGACGVHGRERREPGRPREASARRTGVRRGCAHRRPGRARSASAVAAGLGRCRPRRQAWPAYVAWASRTPSRASSSASASQPSGADA